jgi:NTP pyrophosphatase (non-canonical NTP hydrolase)
MNRLEDIRQWAHARNLIHGGNRNKQFIKLIEEIGEIANGLAKGREAEVVDGIGDTVVVLVILAAQSGVDIEHCIEIAWNTIKDRKGRMVDGIFIKEGD